VRPAHPLSRLRLLLRLPCGSLSVERTASGFRARNIALRRVGLDAEYALRVAFCDKEFAHIILRFVIADVQLFLLREQRRVLLFERWNLRQRLDAKPVEMLLRRPVQSDVRTVFLIEIPVPPRRLIRVSSYFA
jgi:hypothetical protein